jgi:hypothetical protein
MSTPLHILKTRLNKVNKLLIIALKDNIYDKVMQAKYLISLLEFEINRQLTLQIPHLI